MMSRLFVVPAALVATAALLLAAGDASAQKYVRLDVNAPEAAPASWKNAGKLQIPMANAVLDVDGHLVVSCDQVNTPACNTLNIGGATGGTGTIPANTLPQFALTVPSAPVEAVGQSVAWAVPNARADVCYGLSATSTTTGAPAVTGWTKEWPASGSFSLNALRTAIQNATGLAAGADVNYSFTMRCYSKTKFAMQGGDAVAVYDDTRTVTMRKSGSTPPTGDDFCAEYQSGAAGYVFENGAGFNIPALQQVPVSFSYFTTYNPSTGVPGTGTPITFEQLIVNGVAGQTLLPGTLAGQNTYASIALDVPANLPDLTGFNLRWVTPQNGGAMLAPGRMEISVSPCPGDFRRPTNNNSPDYWNRRYCRWSAVGAGGPMEFSTGQNNSPSNICFLPKGKRMYLNLTMHNISVSPPAYMCNNATGCGYRFDVARQTGF